ncbi:MAG: protein translocase subunit yajC [Bacillota bacterium]|nr:MAG: protein translocase subunit yajC [Bacillota bacterium]
MDSVLWGKTISLGAMVFAFYVFVLRPQRQEMLRHRKIVAELKKGDQIITAGGLVGTVAGFKGEHFVSIRVAEGVEVLLRKDGIDALLPEALR